MALFKIGDRVRIVSPNSGYYDQAGIITGIQRASDDQHESETRPGYVVQLDNGQLEFFAGADLELK